jgi:hypothetical protein
MGASLVHPVPGLVAWNLGVSLEKVSVTLDMRGRLGWLSSRRPRWAYRAIGPQCQGGVPLGVPLRVVAHRLAGLPRREEITTPASPPTSPVVFSCAISEGDCCIGRSRGR